MELDIYLPNLNLSFEFQDPYHYTTSRKFEKPLEVVQRNDGIQLPLEIQNHDDIYSFEILKIHWQE